MAMVVLSLTVLVGACSGGDDDDEPTTTVATTATTPTTARTATTQPGVLPRLPEVFARISGFEYVELPESDLEDLQDQFTSDAEMQEAVAAVDGRTVTRDGDGVAVIIAVGFDERSSALPGFRDGFLSGATQNAVDTEELTLSGEEAILGTDADGTSTILWLKGDLALVIVGGDPATLRTVATALIAANK